MAYGSACDTRVLRNSSGYEEMNIPANAVIPGDIGYEISPCLMTPYNNSVAHGEKARQLFTKLPNI